MSEMKKMSLVSGVGRFCRACVILPGIVLFLCLLRSGSLLANGAELGQGYGGTALSAGTGGTVIFGRYEQDDNLSDGPEPIEWLVLDETENGVLLISRYGLDMRQYHNDWDYNTWEYCSLRAWLNGEFLESAFAPEEQGLIMDVPNQNPDNPTYGTPGGNLTYDRVFVLNYQEAEQYFPDDSARTLFPTEYANAQAASLSSDGSLHCWLRTSGNSNCQDAAVIDANGSINLDGKCVDKYELVRPVIWVAGTDAGSSAGSQTASAQDLTAYLHQPISDMARYFEGLSEPSWAMGITSCYNQQVSFRSCDGVQVTGGGLSACESPYSLKGVRTSMTLSEADEVLTQQGFTYLQPAVNRTYESYVYYDGARTFVTLWQEGGYLGAGIDEVGWGLHTDRQEAAFYMGKTMEQVMNEVGGLSVRTEGSKITLEKEDICFSGVGSDLSDTIVSEIYLTGEDCGYSLYGTIPGDDWEEIRTDLGFEFGGSGELIDPFGYVLYYNASLRNVSMNGF